MEDLSHLVVLEIPYSAALAELLESPGHISDEISLEIGGAGWPAKILSAGPRFPSKKELGSTKSKRF